MKRGFIFSLFLFIPLCQLLSQASIRGTVIDAEDNKVVYATVALLDSSNNLINGTVSDETGVFNFEDLHPVKGKIVITYTGYESYSSGIIDFQSETDLDLGHISLGKPAVDLNEVEVVAQRALIEVHADKMVFNVDGTANFSGNNGMDLLGKAPGVTIDPDGNIHVLGKDGVRIFINGRASNLSGADLYAMLQSMQSDNILSIEIITNPSARYEAEGNAGIINILLKKNVSLGLNGSITSNYSKGDYRQFGNSLSLNYRGGKVNSYVTITQSDIHEQEDFIDLKELSSGLFLDQKALGINRQKSFTTSGGLDYSISNQHSLGFIANVLVNNLHDSQNAPTQVYNLDDLSLIETLISNSEDKSQSLNSNYNLNYLYQPNEGTTLSADFSIGDFNSDGEVLQPNKYLNPDGDLIREANNKFNTNTLIDIIGGQVDLETRISPLTISTGARATHIQTENEFAFYQSPNGTYILDTTRSNDFTYDEKVIGGYLILNTTVFKKLDIHAGLRIENTVSRGKLVSQIPTENEDVNRKYTDYFPNISLAYNASDDHSISVSYGRRITRPNYQDLNPFEKKVSEITTFKGNPFLQAQYITNYQITLDHRIWKERLVASVQFSQNEGFFARILEIRDDRETFIIPRNMKLNNTLSATLSYPSNITSWWETISFANFNNITYEGEFDNADIGINRFVYSFRLQNNIQLPSGFFLDVTASYQSPWIWRGTIQIASNSRVNIGLRKDFFNKKLQIRLTGTDIFNTSSDYPYHGDYGGLIIDGTYRSDNSRYGITASWKFGNQDIKSASQRKSGLNTELERISE